ncbi:MAG: 2-amino-4-hydroxy-6-hydroxymethyldihydropteridine diphosphokinase [Proteobacteria bacterium]|nr:2-amino-4-hydroxy-6-hydroxymethyldihydropteridine diphosphokinase [Pseudomonadota bacterium]
MSVKPAATRAYLALGGNVGDSRATLDRAVLALSDTAGVHLFARSSDYRTPPWGVTDQPPFINLCLVIDTTLSPRELLACIHEIERSLGRDRAQEERWGPRTVDIDILAYDDLTLDEPGLILPHPRLYERAFVLMPLAEIAGDAEIAGQTPRAALARLDTTGIERLQPRR